MKKPGPPIKARSLAMVASYVAGSTLTEVARDYGVSLQRVHYLVKTHAPSAMREIGVNRPIVSAGPPGQEIYMVGQCAVCEAPIGSYRMQRRTICTPCKNEIIKARKAEMEMP